MTVPIGVNTNEFDVGLIVERELAELIRVARTRMSQV